jgi:diguanylate cyclase (GGDEF)-like protein
MAAGRKILVVDDEPHIRKILQFLLEQEGFQVTPAENGEVALDKLKSFTPDLILLDVMMPRMDGFTVLQHLRDNFQTSWIPVIMLTAKGESSEKVRGLKGGANDYLTKPFNHDELMLRMRNMLDWSQAQRDANPLTGLPGNRAIEQEVQRRLQAGAPFSFLYLDIDHFKSFNDYYGYSRGDEAINFLARLLRRCSAEAGDAGDFVGHVGGDDFIVITTPEKAERLGQRIIDEFDTGVADLYDPADRERGYVCVRNRAGVDRQMSLLSLTVALATDTTGRTQHLAQLSDIAAELKSYGKALPGSVLVRERRSPAEAPAVTVAGHGTGHDR